MSNIKCLYCFSDAKKVRFFAKRENEKISLYVCKTCKTEFLHPFPSSEWLDEEYSGYYQKRQVAKEGLKVPYFKYLFKKLNLDLTDKKVLEFGPGEGDAILAAQDMYPGVKFTAVERNPEALPKFEKLNSQFHNMFLEEFLESDKNDQKYDAVFLFDVIEHLRNPSESLDKIFRLLATDGIIVATFPVADSLSRKVLGSFWPQYKVEHLTYPSRRGLDCLVNRLKHKIIHEEVLKKQLPMEYLLNVGSYFGPNQVQKVFKQVSKLVPTGMKKKNLTLGFGEKVVILK